MFTIYWSIYKLENLNKTALLSNMLSIPNDEYSLTVTLE